MIIDLQLFASLSGSYVIDYRRDPITGTFVSEEITEEPETVIIIPGSGGRRGFWLIEVPDPNFAIILTRTETVDNFGVYTPDASPPTYILVTGAPATEEYFVRLEQGLVILNNDEFNNVSQLGNKFEVAYYGLGTNMNVKNTQFIETATLLLKLSRDGSLAMTGDLNFGSFKGVSLANGTVSSDAVNKGQLDSGLASISSTVASIQAGKDYISKLASSYGGSFATGADVTEDRYIYYLDYENMAGGFNVTGVPNTDGILFFIYPANATVAGNFLRVHGSTISTFPSIQAVMVAKINGSWTFSIL